LLKRCPSARKARGSGRLAVSHVVVDYSSCPLLITFPQPGIFILVQFDVLFLNCCEGGHEILISNCARKLSESQCKNISKHQDNAHVYPRLFGLGTWHRCPKLVGFMPGSIFPQMPIRADHGEIERFLQWRGQHSAESR
jgi:hypothetical protein